jgi:hypothetical protein
MEEQTIYLQDTFGLQTIHQSGRLIQNIVPGIPHVEWMEPENFMKYVFPLLD